MGKWTILVIVLLLGVMLALQALLNKRKPQATVAMPAQSEPAEQSAPAPAPAQDMQGSMPAATPYVSMSAKAPAGNMPADGRAFESACTGGAGLDAYVTAREGLKTLDALKAPDPVAGPMLDYFVCKSVMDGNSRPCDYMPDRLFSGTQTPRAKCLAPLAGDLFFVAYMAGKNPEGRTACLQFAEKHQVQDQTQFCDYALSVGMDKICLKANTPGCTKMFPVKKEDCGSAEDCVRRYEYNRAFKSGDPALCPERGRAACAALILRAKGHSCSELAAKAEKAYCSYIADMDKEAARRLKSEEDARLTAQKKADQALLEQQNKEVRKLLGR